MHTAVQEFHRRHAKGDVMSDEALAASFEAACTSEGFLTREHEEARLAAGKAALRRFREDQLKPDAVIPVVRRAGVQLQPGRRPDPRSLGPGGHRGGRRRRRDRRRAGRRARQPV